MPLFSYRCPECGLESKRVVTFKSKDAQFCDCGAHMERLASSPGGTLANETVDEYYGKKIEQGLKGKIDERAKEHFRKHDLPRIIEREGLDFAKRMGYVDDEGNPK